MAVRLLNQPQTTQLNQPPGPRGSDFNRHRWKGVNFQTVFTQTEPLAEVAGLEEGFHEGGLDEPIAR
jgi:hypothetical protein